MISAQDTSHGTGSCSNPAPENGGIVGTSSNTYSVGAGVRVRCHRGFISTEFLHPYGITCNEPGIWRPSPPECIPNHEGKYNLYFLLRQICEATWHFS